MAEWISPSEAPNHTWGWVIWAEPDGDGRMLALGARDGAFWRADGYTVPADRSNWRAIEWCPLVPPDM